eukprot:8903205-Heterocapsa_arctica.AAC.1
MGAEPGAADEEEGEMPMTGVGGAARGCCEARASSRGSERCAWRRFDWRLAEAGAMAGARPGTRTGRGGASESATAAQAERYRDAL